MLSQAIKLIAFLLIVINACNFISIAQEAPKVQAAAQPASTPSQQPVTKETDPKAKTTLKAASCPCLEPAIALVQKAYNSLEEDEWPAAIKISTDTVNAINSISKTCKCPEVADYQNVAMAYLNYSKAGNLLDGEDEPDCKVAKKLYEDAINWLETSIPKITNSEVNGNAGSIQEYAKEELQFVKDECEEPKQDTNTKQLQGKQEKPVAPTKQ